ncbi:type 4a pilus biogenesis protein PilO [Candidatus Azambacteria bacterium]|nr:type 4a pilus biogenesis protein PilO [Candidatus Azambacteria bacterium]
MDRRYITGTIFLTIAVICAVVFTEPEFRSIAVMKNSLKTKQAEFDGQYLLIQEVDNINKDFAKVLENVNKVNDVLPKFTSIADLLVRMDYLTSRNGLVIKDISFDGPSDRVADSSKYLGVRVNLKVVGSYASFLNFGNDIKNNRHLMDISQFSISGNPMILEPQTKGRGEQPERTFNFDIKIDVYYQG